jgi:hypothetical protein
VINSHVPFQLGYRPRNIRKKQKAPTFVGASEIESELRNLRLRLANNQTNPEGRARLTRRLIMDLVCIIIFVIEYSIAVTASKLVNPSVYPRCGSPRSNLLENKCPRTV